MSHAVRRYAPWLALLWMVSACAEPSFLLRVELEQSLGINQIRVRGSDASGALGEVVAPELPGRMLESGETLRLYWPAQYTPPLRLLVEGLKDGERVSAGVRDVSASELRNAEITVWLEPETRKPDELQEPTPDAGTSHSDADAGTPPPRSCADCAGCCREGFCVAPTFNTCGSGGVACERCDATRADQCSPQGFCACGQRAACGMTADNCTDGRCRCGQGTECGAGQQCLNGQCVCTPSSCGGCCEGRTCLPGNAKNQCGSGGATCMKCKKVCLPNGTCQ